MKRVAPMVFAAALVVAAAALAVVAVRGPSSPTTLRERTRAVAETLRCPVCEDLSAADSPSGVAQQMRAAIARDLGAGRTPDQIRAAFVRAYGPWILLAPPKRGIDLVAWIAPVLLALAGVAVAVLSVRRWTADGAPSSPPVNGPDATTVDADDRRLLDVALASMSDEPD